MDCHGHVIEEGATVVEQHSLWGKASRLVEGNMVYKCWIDSMHRHEDMFNSSNFFNNRIITYVV